MNIYKYFIFIILLSTAFLMGFSSKPNIDLKISLLENNYYINNKISILLEIRNLGNRKIKAKTIIRYLNNSSFFINSQRITLREKNFRFLLKEIPEDISLNEKFQQKFYISSIYDFGKSEKNEIVWEVDGVSSNKLIVVKGSGDTRSNPN